MKFSPVAASFLFLSIGLLAHSAPADSAVRVQGIPALSRVLKAAAGPLRDRGIEIKIGEDSTNAQAVSALGSGEIDLALLGRSLNAEERASYPSKAFEETRVGWQVAVLLVSRSVWESGVRALKREQVAELYEGRASSWQAYGGEDRTPKFFDVSPGQGIWELFAGWVYGDLRKAPAVTWELVADGSEAQTAVQFHAGGISMSAPRWADGRNAFALGVINEGGVAVEPTGANITAGTYPLARAILVAVAGRPTGGKRKIIEFLLSKEGQALVAESDLVPVAAPAVPFR